MCVFVPAFRRADPVHLFPIAQLKLALLGAFSFPIFGALYYIVPRIHRHGMAVGGSNSGAFWTFDPRAGGDGGQLAGAGWVQGQGLSEAGTSFVVIAARTKPWLSGRPRL